MTNAVTFNDATSTEVPLRYIARPTQSGSFHQGVFTQLWEVFDTKRNKTHSVAPVVQETAERNAQYLNSKLERSRT